MSDESELLWNSRVQKQRMQRNSLNKNGTSIERHKRPMITLYKNSHEIKLPAVMANTCLEVKVNCETINQEFCFVSFQNGISKMFHQES